MINSRTFKDLPTPTQPAHVVDKEENLHGFLKRVGRKFSELLDRDRNEAYKYLRRELASNVAILVSADEVSNLRDWISALQKVEEALGGNETADEFPLDKIAKMLNDA